MFDYQEMYKVAADLIKEFGGVITVTTEATQGEYDPETGGFIGGTPGTSTSLQGLLLKYNKQEGLLSDTTIVSKASKVLLAGLAPVEVGQIVNIAGVGYTVAYKDVVRPDTQTAIITVMVVML